jgi:membrane associated rhomboid family serine protease
MTDQNDASRAEAVSRRPGRQPIINAPLLVVLMSALLVALHALVTFSPEDVWGQVMWDYAVFPARFWAPAGSPEVYPDHLAGFITLVSTALLHADWAHVMVNSLMLLAFGTPVARALGQDARGWAFWMLLFVGSVIGGSVLYLMLAEVDSPYLVGASGGTSGLIAAAFLLDAWGAKRPLWAREFLLFSLVFALTNLLLVFAGPYIFGASVSWEAHLGGYVVGALLMTVLPVRAHAGSRL